MIDDSSHDPTLYNTIYVVYVDTSGSVHKDTKI